MSEKINRKKKNRRSFSCGLKIKLKSEITSDAIEYLNTAVTAEIKVKVLKVDNAEKGSNNQKYNADKRKNE